MFVNYINENAETLILYVFNIILKSLNWTKKMSSKYKKQVR